jgi:hypothetical protein
MAEVGNYLEEDVAAQVRVRLEEHLAHCQTCTVLLDSSRKTLRIVTDSGSFDLPDADFSRITTHVMANIREKRGTGPQETKR